MHSLPSTWSTACLFAVLALCAAPVQAQEGYRFERQGPLDWSMWEARMSDEQVQATLDTLAYEYSTFRPGAFAEDVHVVDFSGDGKLDLIYNEMFGESPVLVMLRQGESRFELAFEGWGYLSDMRREHAGAPVSFRVYLPGCCADTRDFWTVYVPVRKADTLAYRAADHAMLARGKSDMPSTFFDTAIEFRTTQPRYNLRYQPVVENDSINRGGIQWQGNVIAAYPKDTRGRALADSTDETGRTWWFVVIPAQYTPLQDPPVSLESFNETGLRPSLLGWMSSRYLEVVQP